MSANPHMGGGSSSREGGVRRPGICRTPYCNRAPTPWSNFCDNHCCQENDCTNGLRDPKNGSYCFDHQCLICHNSRAEGSKYCGEYECEASSRATGKSRNVEGVITSDQEDDEGSDEDEKDLFLQALLHPNEHAHRLLEVRTRVADLCRVSDILNGVEIPVEDTLRSVVMSFGLLRDAGLMQDSLILLADDPERIRVIQAVGIDVRELENLEMSWRVNTPSGEPTSHISQERMRHAADKLLKMLRPLPIPTFKFWTHDDGGETVRTSCYLLALATASYAGSHCHSFDGGLLPPGAEGTPPFHLNGRLAIRLCRFDCLFQYIGGPVWTFGYNTDRNDKLLSITTKQFDDLWGPVTTLVEPKAYLDSKTIALQTEGGSLSKTELGLDSLSRRENEVPMHWTPAQHGDRSLPGVGFDIPVDSSFNLLEATLLIGFGEQKEDSTSCRKPAHASRCFEINRNCKLDAKAYESLIEARRFEYIGTAKRQWIVDTKAVNIAAGRSGPSIGTTRTWKLRPATSWKAAMLQYCNEPGRAIKPLMKLRVGLARSICTGNARRVSLLEALNLAFPGKQQIIEELISLAKTDESARRMFMNYFNDLAQTGTDGKDCLKLFWPFLAQTILRIDQKLPKWNRMLHDGQATCCFAVAVDDCLVHWEDSARLCRSEAARGDGRVHQSHAMSNLFSTTINLQENPTAKLPLTSGAILKLSSGRLSIAHDLLDGFAQLACFWLPSAVDKVSELRLGPRTHTELLDLGRSTGLCVDVCIIDK